MMRGAHALARRGAVPALAVRIETLPGDVDPLRLLDGATAAQRFYWAQPARGVALAGLGSTLSCTGAGPDRLAEAAALLAEALHQAPGAVAVGGFAFADRGSADPAWSGFAPVEWVVPEVAAVRRAGRCRLVATAPLEAGRPALDAAIGRARAALARTPRPDDPPARYCVAGSPPAPWQAMVGATLDDIAAGQLTKLVLARTASVRASAPFDPVRVLDRLRRQQAESTLFAVGRGAATFLGASPERLARVAGDRLDTAAVAGTARRGASQAGDRAVGRALAASPKERREHALVVDDVRARLAPLCADVAAPAAPRLLVTHSLQHLHTPIRARLRPGVGLLDAVAALHPTPAVCGAPRAEAARTLATREGGSRGWYAGGVGWLDGRSGEVTVALRTALLRGDHALLHAGAGIVAGSAWEAELEETRLKMRPLLGALLEL